eukprot:SAG31_NODE_5326_length_2609_cov_1.490837_3_plen_64_part_00
MADALTKSRLHPFDAVAIVVTSLELLRLSSVCALQVPADRLIRDVRSLPILSTLPVHVLTFIF